MHGWTVTHAWMGMKLMRKDSNVCIVPAACKAAILIRFGAVSFRV